MLKNSVEICTFHTDSGASFCCIPSFLWWWHPNKDVFCIFAQQDTTERANIFLVLIAKKLEMCAHQKTLHFLPELLLMISPHFCQENGLLIVGWNICLRAERVDSGFCYLNCLYFKGQTSLEKRQKVLFYVVFRIHWLPIYKMFQKSQCWLTPFALGPPLLFTGH